MFYPPFHRRAWLAAHAQVEHEAGVLGGKAAELGGGHSRPAQEDFDLADQHSGATFFQEVGDSLSSLWSRPKSYLSRKNTTCRND